MIDLETLAASCATMADEIVAHGSSDTFRYDAAGILEFGDSPEYYSPIYSSAYRSEYPETAREYGYTRAMTASASTRSTSTKSCYAPAPPRPTRTDARRSRPPSRATSTWTASKATSTAPWPTWTTTT